MARLRVILRTCVTAVEFNGVWFDDHSARESGLLSFSLLPWVFVRRCVLSPCFHGDNYNLDFNYRVFLGESLILRHFFLDDVWMQLSQYKNDNNNSNNNNNSICTSFAILRM